MTQQPGLLVLVLEPLVGDEVDDPVTGVRVDEDGEWLDLALVDRVLVLLVLAEDGQGEHQDQQEHVREDARPRRQDRLQALQKKPNTLIAY